MVWYGIVDGWKGNGGVDGGGGWCVVRCVWWIVGCDVEGGQIFPACEGQTASKPRTDTGNSAT